MLFVAAGGYWLYQYWQKTAGTSKMAEGEVLAKKYCASCHIFSEAVLLDKKTWRQGVLPNMGLRLGLRTPGQDPYADMEPEEAALVKMVNLYPEKPQITPDEWLRIVEYYEALAPEVPGQQPPHPAIADSMAGWEAQSVFIGEKQTPGVTMVLYDAATGQLYVGDTQNQLYILNSNMTRSSNWFMPSPPVDMDFPKGQAPRLMCIGSLAPTQKRNGNFFSFDPENRFPASAFRFDSVHRPVSFATADLNGDGKEDGIVCCFGNHTGKISWYNNFDPTREHMLLEQPGARRAQVADITGDGLPDIVALMAQGREELVLFENVGNGEFKLRILQQFPSVYGVSDFELADINSDGRPDILVTNGDNWDLSPIKKFYHGLRIYENKGDGKFEEAWFYPSYGATRARAADFDKDGDLDIALVSFSDDLAKTEHGLVLLTNDGSYRFRAASHPGAANGKWITIEVADLDRDGDQDIVLGSFLYNIREMGALASRGVEQFPHLVVLWNGGK